MQKRFHLFLLFSFFSLSFARAQALQPPCTLQARVNHGICFDPPGCLPFYGYGEGGTPPYLYQWSTGGTFSTTYLPLSLAVPGMDTCVILTLTDAAGCVAIASWRYTVPSLPYAPIDSSFLLNDTVFISDAVGNFNVGVNDHILAQDYLLVQPPAHGTLDLDAEGNVVYTADPDWCGPDHFRYTATDTGGCNYASAATVWIERSPCAGILSEKVDCNASCNGAAVFYQNGVLTPPLTYLWSNGSTENTAEELCAGPVFVTVTDALGTVETYNSTIEAADLQVSISGPSTTCVGTSITLNGSISSQNNSGYTFYWVGEGFDNMDVFDLTPWISTYSNVDTTRIYYLHVLSESGCNVTSTFEVDLLPRPSMNLFSDVIRCPGDTLEIRAGIVNPGTPPYTYSWSGPAGIQSNWSQLVWPDINNQHSGSYGLTLTDANGCSAVGNKQINIPDTCTYGVTILNDNYFCSGSDVTLRFGMSPTWFLGDEITWTGPNGFFSHAMAPLLEDVQPDMSGWYYVQMRFGNSIVLDSSFLTFSLFEMSITDFSMIPPTDCIAPYDGVISIQLSAPPPYQVKYSDLANVQTVNTNPIVRTDARAGPIYLQISKGTCSIYLFPTIPIPDPPQIIVQDETCAGGDASILVQSIHPINVDWALSNGVYVPDQPELTDLVADFYRVFIKDETTNCIIFGDTVFIEPYMDFDIAVLDTPACTITDGSLLVIPSDEAVPPISYAWNNGFDGNPATDLAPGGYSVTLTDGEGCIRHKNVVLVPEEACIAQVSGRVYVGLDCDCILDDNTFIFPLVHVTADNGTHSYTTYVGNTGYYHLALTEPGTYTVTAQTYHNGVQGACTEHTVTIDDITQDMTGLDFYFCGPPESDLQVVSYCGNWARPGFQFSSSVSARNNGILASDTSTLVVQVSPHLSNVSFSVSPDVYDPMTQTATWILGRLNVQQQFSVLISGTVTANLGDTITLISELTPTGDDPDLANNSYECSTLVTGAFDPNDKLVSPLGVGEAGNIAPQDSVLTYTIRFQNTGTDTAFTVVVRDTLDTGVFNVNSVRPLYSSHPFQLDVEDGHILVFTFSNINLPDSNRTVVGSQGFVMFSVGLKNGLPDETRISNSAAIYFDYNAPVITNSAENTVLKTQDPAPDLFGMTLVPNPAVGQTLLFFQSWPGTQWIKVSLLDLNGRLLRENEYAANGPGLSVPIQTGHLPAGVYVVSVKSNLGQGARKLVVAPR